MSSLLSQFGLIIEYGKTEVFYFSKLYGCFSSPSLNITILDSPIL